MAGRKNSTFAVTKVRLGGAYNKVDVQFLHRLGAFCSSARQNSQ